jgi:hypothetical protein
VLLALRHFAAEPLAISSGWRTAQVPSATRYKKLPAGLSQLVRSLYWDSIALGNSVLEFF